MAESAAMHDPCGSGASLLAIALCLAAAAPAADAPRDEDFLFYRRVDYGSDALFNPLTSLINSALDTLQVPRSFDRENIGERLDEVWDNLRDPLDAIERSGGSSDFINRQVFPIDPDNLDDSLEMIPNYALHLFGGGMIYRKNVEWLRAKGYPLPRISAIALVTVAELYQEAIEKKSTTPDDEVADVYLFRPAGILLFGWERFARYASRRLGMLEWPYQPMYDGPRGKFANVGQNFVLRPTFVGSERHRGFAYFGMTNLAGVSHRVGDTDRVSWGVGQAIVEARRDFLEMRTAGGIFWDRDGSLLASLIVNGTDDLAARLNVYPGVLGRGRWSPGLYLGIRDDDDVALGVFLRVLPLGYSQTR